MVNQKEPRENKHKRLLEVLGNMEVNDIYSPTVLAEKSHIHLTTLTDYLKIHKSLMDADIEILMNQEGDIKFIRKIDKDEESNNLIKEIKRLIKEVKDAIKKT